MPGLGWEYCLEEDLVRLETARVEDLSATLISCLPPLLTTELSALAKGRREKPRDVLWRQTNPGEPSGREQREREKSPAENSSVEH